MKIQNAFRLGLFGGLGVVVALAFAAAVGSLATIITYIGAALFLALGLDPLVTWLERRGVKRPLAILITLVGVLALFAGLVLAIIPVVSEQVGNLIEQITALIPAIADQTYVTWVRENVPWIDVDQVVSGIQGFFDPGRITEITAGVLQVGVQIASGAFGAIIVLILLVYFVSSLGSIKRNVYQLVPASRRARFIDLAEQISDSVGRYVMGQVTLALINGVLSFFFLTILQVRYSALLAFLAFLGSLIPLVGTLTASVVITLSVLLFQGWGWQVIVVGIYYLVYMQVEAYVINPRIMARAVQVPGVVVVIAALVGGTLLGVLGALIAIPVAAAVQLIVREVVVPRQNEL